MRFINRLFGKDRPHDENPWHTLLALSLEELRLKTEGHQRMWRFGEEATWALNQDDGTLIFRMPQGLLARCPAQIIGTYNASNGSWLWAWHNPSIQDTLKTNALKMKAYGEAQGYEQLTVPHWQGTEADAWAMTALAAKVCNEQGAYRGPAGATYVFMTFGKVQLRKLEGGT